jgi:3,4-dehydroadipyl-CoA semialdehyde dehydrogenase
MSAVIASNKTDVPLLQSYLSGRWQSGCGEPTVLVNPATGEALVSASAEGLDLNEAFAYARTVGGPGLRKMAFGQRAELLGKIADVLAGQRDRWFQIARENSGNTKADAAIDVDGSIGTLKYFAKTGAKLANGTILSDGPAIRLARDANFHGIHIGVPVHGLALHINAFNFPAWGLWEKAAVSLLAGVPVVSKPATATSWLAQEMVAGVTNAGVLPEGSLSVICGTPRNLLDLRFGDVVAFTGSASTAETIRQHPRIREQGIRLNVEADSLNAALLGPDANADSPIFNHFVREVVREMTSKAGQKCTAIRRVLVSDEHAKTASDAIAAALAKVPVGNPSNETVGMGPLVNAAQRKAVEEGIRTLGTQAAVAYQSPNFQPVDADPKLGAFVPPTLMRAQDPDHAELVHTLEIFGPASTVVPYHAVENAFALARRGGGSLAVSVFSDDTDFLAESAAQLGSSHGRVLLVDSSIADTHTGHGIVLPSCLHGGPGRAGGGEELGGLHALWFYHQRLAVQGSGKTIAALAQRAANPAQG